MSDTAKDKKEWTKDELWESYQRVRTAEEETGIDADETHLSSLLKEMKEKQYLLAQEGVEALIKTLNQGNSDKDDLFPVLELAINILISNFSTNWMWRTEGNDLSPEETLVHFRKCKERWLESSYKGFKIYMEDRDSKEKEN